MTNFDLVIISNSLEGRSAAKKAVKLNYRVALVEWPFTCGWPSNERILIDGLIHFAKIKNNFQNEGEMGFNFDQNFILNPNFQEILAYIQEQIITLENENSLAILSALGVDLIQSTGAFFQKPRLNFTTENRQFFGKNYLITIENNDFLPKLPDFTPINYLTLKDLFVQEKLSDLKQNITIFAENSLGIELAYSLAILGKDITLIMAENTILPCEDVSISAYIQAMLEAKGVKILTDSKISQIKKIDQTIWLQAGDQAIEIDDFIYVDQKITNLNQFNFESVKVKFENQSIIVNQQLQTTNRKIYACGSIIGGYNNFNITTNETKIALKNIKSNFLFSHNINYYYLPYQILNYPNCARVGLTEKQARNYDHNLIIIEDTNVNLFNQLFNPIFFAKNLDYFKLILTKNQEILGVHLIGENADQLINIFALAMANKIKIF